MTNYEHIKREIARHKVISFDVFDTLLKRNVRHSDDVLKLTEREFNKRSGSDNQLNNFLQLRRQAEIDARQKSKNEDVCIDEIYNQLALSDEYKNALKDSEIEIEQSLSTTNIYIKELYNYALSIGKIIVIVSDMYLPYHVIATMLHSNGYNNFAKLYLSSEDGLTKSSGNLFRKMLSEMGVRPFEVLHIGDAKKGDWLRPKLLGISTIHIKTHVSHLLYGRDKMANKDLDASLLYQFLNNTTSAKENRYFNIGYETLGPVLFGFCKWLYEQTKIRGIDRLLFFSRDGQIIHNAFKILYPEFNCQYVYVSRRSLVVPLIHFRKNIADVFEIVPFYRYTPIRAVFERMGLDYDNYKELINKFGLDENTSLTKEDYLSNSNFLKLYSEIENDIYANSKLESDAFERYISSLNIGNKIGIVDIGWKGTMQNAFEKYLIATNKKIQVTGFYLGTLMKTENACGYIFGSDERFKEPLLSFAGLFETLFSADHGSVKRYAQDGKIELYDFEYKANQKSTEDYELIRNIQAGAINFVNKFNHSIIKNFLVWDNKIAFTIMAEFGMYAKMKDLKTIGNIYFFEHKILYLAKPNRMNCLMPTRLIKDFSIAPWKIGYLRRLLIISLPYFGLYRLIRKVATRG